MNAIKKKRQEDGGFSLVEILVAVFILVIGIVGALFYMTTSMESTAMARDITTATTHAQSLLEEMQTRPTLSNIVSTNWIDWAANNGLNSLDDETVAVNYADPAANPLDVKADVSWTTKGRSANVTLETEMTK